MNREGNILQYSTGAEKLGDKRRSGTEDRGDLRKRR